MRATDLFEHYTQPTIMPSGVQIFAAVLEDAQALDAFLIQNRRNVLHFLTALTLTEGKGPELVTRALEQGRNTHELASGGDADEVLDVIELLPLPMQARILAAPYAVAGLCDEPLTARRVYDMLMRMTINMRAGILQSPGAQSNLKLFVEETGMTNLRRRPPQLGVVGGK